jgi:hypothetical protein
VFARPVDDEFLSRHEHFSLARRTDVRIRSAARDVASSD